MRQIYATHDLDSLSLNRTKQRTWMENAHANNFNKAKCGKDCNQIESLLDGFFIALIVFSPAIGQEQVSPVLPLFRLQARLQNLPPCPWNATSAC